MVDPLPICPDALPPQHQTLEPLVPQVCAPPRWIVLKMKLPTTGVGVWRSVFVPSPSWPSPFHPQQYAFPSPVKPQTWAPPAPLTVCGGVAAPPCPNPLLNAMYRNRRPPRTSVGVDCEPPASPLPSWP